MTHTYFFKFFSVHVQCTHFNKRGFFLHYDAGIRVNTFNANAVSGVIYCTILFGNEKLFYRDFHFQRKLFYHELPN